MIEDHRHSDGGGSVTMADPEGNDFCLERGDHERGPKQPGVLRIG